MFGPTPYYDYIQRRTPRSVLPRFLPAVQLVKMVHSHTLSLDATANPTGSVQSKIYPMMPSDPFGAGNNDNQPLQWSQAFNYYHRGIVQGAKITFRRVLVSSQSAVTGGFWNAVIDDEDFPKYDMESTDMDTLMMLPGIPKMKYTGDASTVGPGFNPGNFKVVKFSPRKFYKISKTELNKKTPSSDTTGYWVGEAHDNHSVRVTKPVVKLFYVGPTVSTQNPSAQYWNVKIEYIMLLLRKNEFNEDPIP